MAGTSGIAKVWAFFKPVYAAVGGLTQFRKEWDELTEADREQIRTGVENGSLTY